MHNISDEFIVWHFDTSDNLQRTAPVERAILYNHSDMNKITNLELAAVSMRDFQKQNSHQVYLVVIGEQSSEGV